jgi:hypothetical protein
MSQPLEVPANYFGRGENYILKDDPEELRWFEERFKEWESAHPEDPTGEIALQEEKRKPSYQPNPTKTTITRHDDDDFLDSTKLRLELPTTHIEKLKNFAKFKRRRPRDIVMAWIDQYCKL